MKISNLQPSSIRAAREADLELIAFSSHGAHTRTKIANFSHLEWHDVQVFTAEASIWCELRDAGGLARVLEAGNRAAEAFQSVLAFDAQEEDDAVLRFRMSLSAEHLLLNHELSSTSFSSPVQLFDRAFAAEAFRDPGVTAPRVMCQFNAGVEQVEPLIKRLANWPESFSIDTIELRAQIIEDTCVLEWIACTSSPPLINLKCRLPPAPLLNSSSQRFTSAVTCINLSSAHSCLLRPLNDNEKLLRANGAVLAVMMDGSVCVSLRWNVIAGFGPIMTIIQIPGLVTG